MRYVSGLFVVVFVCSGVFASRPAQRTLTLDDRVRAQEAIERVYYSHQIGATKAFEAAVPRAVLERKVRKYLEQTEALAVYWKTSVTDEMLQRELERMAHRTQMPERLLQLYAALGNDPFLIKECLARATIVDRLTHNFYAYDATLHADSRRRAEALHRKLATGELRPTTDHPHRSVVELAISETAAEKSNLEDHASLDVTAASPFRHQLSPDEFRKQRSHLPEGLGHVSALKEERDAFVLSVVLSETTHEVRVANYVIPKTTWDDWWDAVKSSLQRGPTVAVASDGGSLPKPTEGLSANGLPCAADDTWDNGVLDDLPDPRSDHTAVWTGSLMVVWGGNGSGYLNTGGRYDPATDSWTPTTTTRAPSARSSHTAVWTGSLMVVWGGSGDSDPYFLDSGGRYDPTTDSWTETSTTGAPSARYDHTAVWTGSLMVIWGGSGASDPFFLDTGGLYDPAADSWTETSTMGAPSARSYHTAVWTGNKMVVWGGSSGSSLDTGGRYDPTTDSWTETSTAGAPSARSDHTAVWTGSLMVVWGGSGDSDPYFLNTGGRYDPETDIWTETSTTGAPSARTLHTSLWTGNLMVVWGGFAYDGSYHYPDTGGRYDPVADSWTETSTTGTPSARVSHTAIWTGSLIVVWGGNGGGYVLSTGGRYDPATDSWTPTSTTRAPSARASHTAIWTGSLMVVWGGDGFGVYHSTGGRYDPATDSWTPTSTTGAPPARSGQTAVWTGSLIVVWGGYDGNSFLDTGGRYDPTTDSWTETFTTGAPTGRAYHTAVWTGSLMVVWGGYDGSRFLDTGGRYDPAMDNWTVTSPLDAPTARAYHTAIWTGSLMVVWGGNGGGDVLSTGGRYDPASNSWTETSTASAPSARYDHTAVWTGSLMVVWGGNGGGFLLSTGGRYDPVTDSWSETSITSAPSARTYHTAVWTGSLMVVWGGRDPSAQFNSGGRYDPAADSWTLTSTPTAASARSLHTAVWTGSLMVVWGGYGSGYLNTGGRYVLGASVDNDGDGFSECQGECNDSNATVHPGATETCNGIDDDCDGVTDNGSNALCDDNNACTVGDSCSGGVCLSGGSVVCQALDQCHATGICDPATGVCSNSIQPNGTICNDNDLCTTGEACQDGSCTPAFSGLAEPNPRTNGYYKSLCHGSHTGDQLSDSDAACVGELSVTFAGISTVADICNVIEPSQPNNDACGKTEDDLMVLALNICRARVCTAQSIDSQCGSNANVGQSLAESDALLDSPSRDVDSCSHAKCLDEEINTGRALGLDSLTLNLEGGGVRLRWTPPYSNDGTGPNRYKVWRRVQRSLSPFTRIGVTAAPTFLDTTSGLDAFEYEITAVMN